MKLKVFINGKIAPEDRACVSVFDRGLAYGDGLYETMKAMDGKPLFLKEHMKRLKAGGLLPPPLSGSPSGGMLAGVTRAAVMKAARENGIRVREARLSPKDLFIADEAFITNSIMDALPLIKVDGKKAGGGSPGRLTRRIQGLLKQWP